MNYNEICVFSWDCMPNNSKLIHSNLLHAADMGDVVTVSKLIKKYQKLNILYVIDNEQSYTPLLSAVRKFTKLYSPVIYNQEELKRSKNRSVNPDHYKEIIKKLLDQFPEMINHADLKNANALHYVLYALRDAKDEKSSQALRWLALTLYSYGARTSTISKEVREMAERYVYSNFEEKNDAPQVSLKKNKHTVSHRVRARKKNTKESSQEQFPDLEKVQEFIPDKKEECLPPLPQIKSIKPKNIKPKSTAVPIKKLFEKLNDDNKAIDVLVSKEEVVKVINNKLNGAILDIKDRDKIISQIFECLHNIRGSRNEAELILNQLHEFIIIDSYKHSGFMCWSKKVAHNTYLDVQKFDKFIHDMRFGINAVYSK